MDETPPTNELIERLTAKLSPAGREVQQELEVLTGTLDASAEMEARIDEALAHMDHLSEEDQNLLSQIAQLKARAHERRGEEYMAEAKMLEDAATEVQSVEVRFHGKKLATVRLEDETCTLYRAPGGDLYIYRVSKHDGTAWFNYSWRGQPLTATRIWALWPELAQAAGLEG